MLVVEDEPAIAELVALYLRRDGFGVHLESSGDAALAAVRSLSPGGDRARRRPARAERHRGLPGLRAAGDWTPVLFVTARDDEVDRLLGLELGADDYITKPFSPRELALRVRTVLRRSSGALPDVLQVGSVRLDVGERRAFAGLGEVSLTSTEFGLLSYLMKHPRQVFSREQLLSAVWGYPPWPAPEPLTSTSPSCEPSSATLSPIRTVRGVGYSADAS